MSPFADIGLGSLTPSRRKAVNSLTGASRRPTSITLDPISRSVRSLTGAFGVPNNSAEPAAIAHQFLVNNGQALGLPARLVGLQPQGVEKGVAFSRIKYGQVYKKVPVFGAGVSVEVGSDGVINAVDVRLGVLRNMSVVPKASEAQAKAVVQNVTKSDAVPAGQLMILDRASLVGEEQAPQLVWGYTFGGTDSNVTMFVDASTPSGVLGIVTTPSSGGPDSGQSPTTQFHVNPRTETPDFITFYPSLILPEASSGSPTTVALALFQRYPLLYGTGDVPNQLRVVSDQPESGPNPMHHVTLQQIYAGLPVYGCLLKVHLSSTLAVKSVSGNYLRNPGIPTDVPVTQDAARTTATNIMNQYFPTPSGPPPPPPRVGPIRNIGSIIAPDPIMIRRDVPVTIDPVRFPGRDREVHIPRVQDKGLVLLPGVLSGGPNIGNHVAWQFRFVEADVFISAKTGNIAFAIPNQHSARLVFDANANPPVSLSLPTLVLRDGQTVSQIAQNNEIQPADPLIATTLGFWMTMGRASWDGKNADTGLVTNSTFSNPNAQWVAVRNQMWFSAGMVRPDVVGHEFTHGVVQESCGLFYLDEPGAVNEHYADTFGNLVFPDNPPTQWFVGETGPGGQEHYATW